MRNDTYKLNNLINRIDKEVRYGYNVEDNIMLLEKLLEQPYFNMKIKFILSNAYIRNYNIEKALKLKKFVYDKTDKFCDLASLIKLLMNIGYVDEAKKYIDAYNSYNEKNYINGLYYRRLGEYEKGIEFYEKLRFTDLETHMYEELATLYHIKGDVDKEKECYLKIINTNLKHQALVRLIRMALLNGDNNVDELFKEFSSSKCHCNADLIQLKRCKAYYKYLNGILKQKDLNGYLEYQLYSYNKDSAVDHIKAKHVYDGSLYRFNKNTDINELFDYCTNHLDVLVYRDISDLYLVKMPYNIGYLLDMETDLLEVYTIGGTKNILTIYPIPKVGKYNYDRISNEGRNKVYEKR